MGNVGNCGNIHHFDSRITQCLPVAKFGVGANRCSERRRVAGIDKRCCDTEAGQREVHHVERTAVEILRRNDVVAGAEQGRHGKMKGRRAARRAYRAHSTFKGGDPFLENGNSGVRNPTVDMSGRLQIEECGRLIGVGKRVRSGEIDRYRA